MKTLDHIAILIPCYNEEMTIHALDKNLQIEEVAVAYRDRPKGSQSKLNTIKDGVSVIREML